MNPPPINKKENHKYRQHAETIIQHLENGGDTPEILNHLDIVNTFCAKTHKKIKQKCEELLNIGKKVAIIGGDHSSPLGLINALSKTTPFGILHIDAHMDLRKNYQGFTHSHASIMYHACQLNSVQSLTQIGIRDYCQEEENYAQQSKKPIQIFYDEQIYKDKLSGKSWQQIVQSIIDTLPEKIYISFDIDGLIPSLCPKTGTPVPGGLTFNDATYIIEKVAKSGKKIIGFDLCETGNGQWDANVAARIIYRLAISMGITQKILNFK